MKKYPVTDFYIYGDNPIAIEVLYYMIDNIVHNTTPIFGDDPTENNKLSNIVRLFNGGKSVKAAVGNVLYITRISDTEFKLVIHNAPEIPIEAVRYLCNRFEDIHFLYSHEDHQKGRFLTNDIQKRYFTNRYCLTFENANTEYFSNLLSLLLDISVRTGADELVTIDDARRALMVYNGQPGEEGTIRSLNFRKYNHKISKPHGRPNHQPRKRHYQLW